MRKVGPKTIVLRTMRSARPNASTTGREVRGYLPYLETCLPRVLPFFLLFYRKKKNSSREIKRASSERVAFGRAAGTSVAASAGQARAMPPMQRSRSAAAGSRSAADRAHRLNQRWRQAICDARRLQQPCRRSGDGGLIEGAPAGRSQTSPIYGAHLLQNVCEG